MTDQRQCGIDAGAYVVGSLSGDEEVAFRRHLMICADCREEVDELESAVAALPLMSASAPLRSPPATPLAPSAPLSEPPAEHGVADGETRAAVSRPPPGTTRARRSIRAASRPQPRSRTASAGMIALVVATLLTIGLSFASSHDRLYRAQISWSPGSALVKVSGDRGELVLTGMPAPPSGRVYEVWLERPGGPALSVGALSGIGSADHADVTIPGGVAGIAEVLVTTEPAGGSTSPTGTPDLLAKLS